jgi:hypothetical protein
LSGFLPFLTLLMLLAGLVATGLAPVFAQSVPYAESFETNGEGVRYSSSVFDGGANAYFKRTDGTDIDVSNASGYTRISGSSFWAAEYTDGPNSGGFAVKVVDLQEVDVSSAGIVRVTADFASGCARPCFDGLFQSGEDELRVDYSLDGGSTWIRGVLDFAGTSDAVDVGFAPDTDGDGIGDGTPLTNEMQPYSFVLPASAQQVIVRVWVELGENEEIAFDNIRLEEIAPVGVPFTADFETDGNGSSYFPTIEFDDGDVPSAAYFKRTDGTDVEVNNGPYTGFNGSFFWAAADLDDSSGEDLKSLTLPEIDISGEDAVRFVGLFGAGDYTPETPDAAGSYDLNDSLVVRYSTDGGATFQRGLKFAYAPAITSDFNQGIAQDTDFDGIGDGTTLTPTLQPFAFDLPASANSVIIRIDTYLQNSSEQLAFDDLRVEAKAPNPILLVNPIPDQSVRELRTGVVFDANEVFEDQGGDLLTLSVASSDETTVRAALVNADRWIELEGLQIGSSVVTLTAENASGDVNATDFNVTVTTSGPVLEVDVRIALAAEVCTDPSLVSSCSDVPATGDGFGGLRRDTIAVEPGSPVAITYFVENTGTRDVTTLDIKDRERGTILSGGTLVAGATQTITQLFDARTRPGDVYSRMLVSAVASDNVSASSYDHYLVEVPAPEISVDVLLEEARTACTDPSDLATCSTLSTDGPTPTGFRTDTVAVAVNQPVLVEYLVTNTGQTTLTAATLQRYDAYGRTLIESIPVTTTGLAPGENVRIRRIEPAPSAVQSSADPNRALAVGNDAAGNTTPAIDNRDRQIDVFAIWTPKPEVELNALIGIAGEFCDDPDVLSSCRDMPVTGPTPTGERRDTVEVTTGDRLFTQFRVVNAGFARLTEVDLLDQGDTDIPSPIASLQNLDLAPRDTLVIERLYDLPQQQGDSYILPEAIGRDASGTETARRPTDLLGIFAGEADVQVNALIGPADTFCTDTTNVSTCDPIPRTGTRPSDGGRVDTLVVDPDTRVLVEYVVTNTSSATSIDGLTIEDTGQGVVVTETGLGLAPGAEYVHRVFIQAPTSIRRSPYVYTAIVEATNAESTTFRDAETYGLRVPVPEVAMESLVAPADEFCTDLSDISTCSDIPNTGSSFGGLRSDTAAVYAGEPAFVQYRITNTGVTNLTSVRVVDRDENVVVSETGLSLAPGEAFVLERRINGTAEPGISVLTRYGKGTDAGGNSSVLTRESQDFIAFDVQQAEVTINALVGDAATYCSPDASDVSNCSDIPTGGNTPTGARRDTVDALPSGARYLVRYLVENTGEVDIASFEIQQAINDGVDVPSTIIPSTFTPSLAPGESYSQSVLYDSRTVPGLITYEAVVRGEDPSGAALARGRGAVDVYGVQTAGAAFRITTQSGPASIFCENVNDASTCSTTRQKRAAVVAAAKLGNDPQAVRYAFYNDGSVDFVQHSLVDNVTGIVFSDYVETVTPFDSLVVYRIGDAVAGIGETRTATWTAVTSEGDVLTNASDEIPLPVELVQFEALMAGPTVFLQWRTASEANNAGFGVQQRAVTGSATGGEADGGWTAIGFVEGAGTTAEPQDYRFAVDALPPGEYRFRLRQVDRDGRTAMSSEVTVQVDIDGAYRLTPPSPHPIQAASTLSLIARESQPVRVGLFDVLGRRVATLFDGELSSGRAHVIRLNGEGLASGVYFIRIVGDHFRATERVTVVR